jgi:tetratricopeptide (TPR) repeat protein
LKSRKKKRRVMISKHEIGAPPQLSKGSVSLSLCMIVKDEADQLGDCLSQVLPVVDEIVVVDTGSTDDTREIARKLGARVFEFPWVNDFSAARNESLRRATGRYLLWLDADDRIDPEEIVKIQELKAGLRPDSLQAYYLLIQSASPLDGESSFYQLRLFPNKPGVRFEGRVHEQVNFSLQRMGIPGVYLPIRIRHTGYEDPTAVQGKYERNWSILEEDLKKNPDNFILRYYAARTLAGMDRYREAIKHIQKITENPVIRGKEKTFYLHAAILLGNFYLNSHNCSAAQSLFQRLVIEYPDDPIVHYGLGESFYRAGEYAQACSPFRVSLTLPLEFSVFPINKDKFVYDQYYNLGYCYQRLGMVEEAREVWKSYIELYPGHGQTLELLGLLALESGQLSEAADYFQTAIQKGAASDKIFANLGLSLRKLGQWADAEQVLRRALIINPARLEALINLGLLFHQQKDYRPALDYFNRALTLDPHLMDIRLFRSDIFIQSGEVEDLVGECDELLKMLGLERDLTIESLQDLGGLFFQIAAALDQAEKPTLAIQALHVGFSLSPTQATLERIVAKAKEIGQLPATLQRLGDDLSALKMASPDRFAPGFLRATAR